MDWMKLSTTKINRVYKRIFFNHCYLCNNDTPHTLCKFCQQGLPTNLNHCKHCKRPTQYHTNLCGNCQTNRPSYHTCIAPYRFEGIIKTLIHSIKFNQGIHYIRPLTYLLSEHLLETYSCDQWPEQIFYVPSHPKRIKERGFCQTKAMTNQLVKYLKQHLNEKCPSLPRNNPLKKIKHLAAQHSLSRKERLKSQKNSYQLDRPIPKHVALFDDVMTTGSTIENCTNLLLKAGAERVDIWVIARTPDKEHSVKLSEPA
ncbi:MAG: ComF family protein [Oceanospirillaceae bacterium]|nr:ComF family protein [Oceanospirillaceae bacterium]